MVAANIEPLLLKPAEAAECLTISPRKLWSMTNAGEIPCIRMGKAVRYDLADLRDWIEQNKVNLAESPKNLPAAG